MKIIFFDTNKEIETVTGLSHEELWSAGVNLDDWDYGLIIDGKKAHEFENGELNRLLTGCCSNDWVQIKNKQNKWFTIGMAYHS